MSKLPDCCGIWYDQNSDREVTIRHRREYQDWFGMDQKGNTKSASNWQDLLIFLDIRDGHWRMVEIERPAPMPKLVRVRPKQSGIEVWRSSLNVFKLDLKDVKHGRLEVIPHDANDPDMVKAIETRDVSLLK